MAKQHYRVRNWKEYNEALVTRGSITFWFDEAAISTWHAAESCHGRGRPKLYSDMAITCALTLREVFRLPLRATEGLLQSLITMLGLPLKAPDYSTLSYRQCRLNVQCPQRRCKDAVHIVVDSTGLKVWGEGEWKVRQHGMSKRRTWRKVHLAVNAADQVIEAAIVTTNDFKDSEVLPDLLADIASELDQVSADGGYDSHACYEQIRQRGARPVIPPRKDARLKQHGNCRAPTLARDEVIREIRRLGRKGWKRENHYHQRSLAETAMFRLKTVFGDRLKARLFESQATEVLLRCCALNKMTALGMPDSFAVN